MIILHSLTLSIFSWKILGHCTSTCLSWQLASMLSLATQNAILGYTECYLWAIQNAILGLHRMLSLVYSECYPWLLRVKTRLRPLPTSSAPHTVLAAMFAVMASSLRLIHALTGCHILGIGHVIFATRLARRKGILGNALEKPCSRSFPQLNNKHIVRLSYTKLS